MAQGFPSLRRLDEQIAERAPRLERGTKAKALLENELLQDALDRTLAVVLREFADIATRSDGRDQAADYQRVGAEFKAMQKFRSTLVNLVTDGNQAQKDIDVFERQRDMAADQEAMAS